MTLTTEPGAQVDAREQASQPAGGQISTPSTQRLVIGRYRLIEPLGRGGMGRVYRAHDDLLDRPVAVKLIYDDAVSERDMRKACAVEARAAARLSHPGIVRILDSGFDDGHCFVVMELAEGQTLSQLIRESGGLPVERALGLAAQIADALEEAHRQGVVHCDVKPGNLIVDRFERVRLVDFGIARVSNSSTGLTEQDIHGSAKYVAPEQVEGGEIDGRADLYALGVVLFEMLTGSPPFTGGNLASILAQRLVSEPPSVLSVVPSIPPDVDRIVRRAMAREPDDRYQSAGDLRDALRAAREVAEHTIPLPLGKIVFATPRLARQPGAFQTSADAFGQQVGAWLARALRRASGWVGSIVAQPARPRRLRWPSLPAAVGMVALLGLLTGVVTAQCGIVASSSEGALRAEPVDAAMLTTDASALNVAAAAPTEPPPVPTTAPATAPAAAPTEPPPPTSTKPPPTATKPPPTATNPPPAPTEPPAEPPAAPAPAPAAPARPAPPAPRAASAPAPAPAPASAPSAGPAPEAQHPPAQDEQPQDVSTSNRSDEKPDSAAPKPTDPPATAKPEAPKPTLRSTVPDPAPKPTTSQPTLRHTMPDPAPKPAAPQPAGSQPTTPPPAAKPQGPAPAQMKPNGSQQAPAAAPKPASGNGQRENGSQGRGNSGGNEDDKQKRR